MCKSQANSYYDDPHKLIGRFRLRHGQSAFQSVGGGPGKARQTRRASVDARFPLGLPAVNNANYLWINLFYAALSPTGRAGFATAPHSASDAGNREREPCARR